MCGIAGIFNARTDDAARAGVLDRMVDALTHRGPDDRGTFVHENIGIGMRRLSIIDVAGGHQPMAGAGPGSVTLPWAMRLARAPIT